MYNWLFWQRVNSQNIVIAVKFYSELYTMADNNTGGQFNLMV